MGVSPASNHLQSRGAETGGDLLNAFAGGRLRLAKFVLHPEFLPLKTAELMKRQEIDPFHVAEARREISNASDFLHVIGPAWDQNETNPHRSAKGGQTLCEFDHWPVFQTSNAAMQIGGKSLQTKHHEIDRFK